MKKQLIGGVLLTLVVGSLSASVHGAPAAGTRVEKPKAVPSVPVPKVAAPLAVEISCPMSVDVDHSVKTPEGFRAMSATIRGYSLSICTGGNAMFASNASRTVSCYYCDNRQTQVVRMDAPFPEGKTQCTRVGTSYRFSCR